MKKRWLAMGATVASATLTTNLSAATEPPKSPRPRTRYEEAIAEVLARRRAALSFPPSWETALNALREEAINGMQKRPAMRFDIPPGPLRDVLAAFERTTRLRIKFANESFRDIQSAGLVGVFTPEQALERLLAGTGTGFAFSAHDTITIDVAAVQEFVAVTGRAPSLSTPKLPLPIRDIAQTIAVIPKEVIESQGATSLRDVLRNVPGITYQAGEGGGGLPGDSFTLRGFAAGNDMFIDGVRDAGGYSRDTFNVEQVEVAKGPSSSISGRGTTGGAINQVTKSPTVDADYNATLGGGTSDFRRGTFDLNQPVGSEDSGVAFRLNGMWGETAVPGRNVVENNSWGVAPSLTIGLDRPTEVTIKSQHLRQDNVPDYGLPWGASPGFPTGAFQADPAVDQSNFYGLRNYDFENIDSDAASAEIKHRFGGGTTLRNVTRYSDTERDSAITTPRPPNRQLQRRTMGNENIANQTNVNLAFGQNALRHDIAAGVEVSRETTLNRNSAQATNQPSVSLVSPDPNDRPFGPMPVNTGNPSETRLDLVGVYVFDTIRVGEKWLLAGGLRWDGVDVDYRLTPLTGGEVVDLHRSDQMLSWRAAVTYKPRVTGSLYLAYGTAFNPSVDAGATGAGFSNTPTAVNTPNLEPEETRNIEAGGKWDALGGRLSLNAALFRTEKVNARTRNLASEPFVLSGRHRVAGVELGAAGSPTDRWTIMAAYAFMDSRITAANPTETGNDLTLTPEHTFSLWTTYRFPRNITIGGGTQFMDAVFRNTVNTTHVPSYWLLSGLASYDINQHLSLRLNLQNLTDEQYVDRVGGGHYIPGPRRQVMFSTDVRF